MNAGNVAAIIILVGGFILMMKYSKKRMKREVKVIDDISYPKHDRTNRSTTSTRNSKTSGSTKSIGVKRKIKTGSRIQIPKDSSGARGESVKRKDSNSIELHKPTTL